MSVSVYSKLKLKTKYSMITIKVIKRLCDTFYEHSQCINEKYKTFSSDEFIASDRDRFVAKFFKPFVGKYIILINKEVVAVKFGDSLIACEPCSVFSNNSESWRNHWGHGDPFYRFSRKYLRIDRFQAVNQPYGRGYLRMSCSDLLNNSFDIKLDYSTLTSMQFKEITEKEFNAVAELFTDNREELVFNVKRYLSVEEMRERKLLKRKKLVQETIEVLAKDSDEAYSKTTNALEVEYKEQ